MKNIILITLLVSQASSLTWIVSLEARLTERNPTVFLHPYDTPASDTPIFTAPHAQCKTTRPKILNFCLASLLTPSQTVLFFRSHLENGLVV